MSPRAAIVGAGIGGLAAAISLRRQGWAVTVHERAAELQLLGAGLSVWPNGVRALRALGLGELADGAGVPRAGGALRRADGSVLAGFDPGEIERRYGAPLVGIHRADLHDALLDAAGDDCVRLGSQVLRALPGGGVELAGGEVEQADLVVGADGLHSTVRDGLLGDGEPRDSGIVAYRGVVEGAGEVPAGEWWGRGSVVGLLPLSGGRLYWYLAHRGELGDAGELERLAAGYADPVPAVVAATTPEAVLRHRLKDRTPAKRWSEDAVTLLGDAAHPMLPFLGQGACSAMEDAVALGGAIAGSPDIAAGLAEYERLRVRRAARLVKASRAAARIALAPEWANPLRAAVVARTPASVRMRQLDGVLGGRS